MLKVFKGLHKLCLPASEEYFRIYFFRVKRLE